MTPNDYFAKFKQDETIQSIYESCDQHEDMRAAVNDPNASVALLAFVLAHSECPLEKVGEWAKQYSDTAEWVLNEPRHTGIERFDVLDGEALKYAGKVARKARDDAWDAARAQQRSSLLQLLQQINPTEYAQGS